MNKVVIGLVVASAAAWLLPGIAMAQQSETQADVTQLCKNTIGKKGYKGYRHDNVEFMEARSGGYSLTGQLSKGSRRYEFNCAISTRMSIDDLAISSLSGGGDRDGGSAGAPAEVTTACATEADKYWRLKAGTSVPLKSKSTGSGMYEVKVAGGDNRGICIVTEDGDIKGIMNQ